MARLQARSGFGVSPLAYLQESIRDWNACDMLSVAIMHESDRDFRRAVHLDFVGLFMFSYSAEPEAAACSPSRCMVKGSNKKRVQDSLLAAQFRHGLQRRMKSCRRRRALVEEGLEDALPVLRHKVRLIQGHVQVLAHPPSILHRDLHTLSKHTMQHAASKRLVSDAQYAHLPCSVPHRRSTRCGQACMGTVCVQESACDQAIPVAAVK